jgi:hypothetical protein
MRPLIRAVFTLLLLLVFALVAVVGMTHRDTNRFAYLFTKPDGSTCETPCLLGVEALDLPFETIDRSLRSHPALQQARRDVLDQNTVRYSTSDFYVALTDFKDRRAIAIVFFTERQGKPLNLTLSDLLMLVGAPYSIYIQPSGYAADDCAFFEFRVKERIYQVATTPRIKTDTDVCPNFNQEIRGMSFDELELSADMKMTKWLGFATYRYYANEFEQSPKGAK